MSLRFRLIGLVCAALAASLVPGGVIAWVNASRSVQTEMRSALLVGRNAIERAIEALQNTSDPSRGLDALISSFNGNRHLRVWLAGETATGATPVVERSPLGPVPGWFVRVIGVAPVTERVPIVVDGRAYGSIAIETDPHNEILEVWNEFTDSLVTPAALSGLLILQIYVFIGRALRPLDRLTVAMEEVGEGRYRTRIDGRLTPELARLRDSFNQMAARLAAADAENRRLNEQLMTLQEQERSELARDLHDEVSPYLFAINIDAASASRLLKKAGAVAANEHVQSIAEAVRHMQSQVRNMLGRLRPVGLAEFGLREAIENMIAFWRRRRPEIGWQLAISTRCDSLGELMDMTISRVVQEALSNAVRHAEPTQISVSIGRAGDAIRVEVADDGGGIRGPSRPGYGLVGIGERVKAMGGHLTFSNRPGVGFSVVAVLSSPSSSEAASDSVQAVEL